MKPSKSDLVSHGKTLHVQRNVVSRINGKWFSFGKGYFTHAKQNSTFTYNLQLLAVLSCCLDNYTGCIWPYRHLILPHDVALFLRGLICSDKVKRGVTSLLLAHYSSVIIFVSCYVTGDLLVGPESGTLCHVCIIINVLPFVFSCISF